MPAAQQTAMTFSPIRLAPGTPTPQARVAPSSGPAQFPRFDLTPASNQGSAAAGPGRATE
ncbi:hypothetical protein BCR44DRAFT_67938 [Catenaria anguillulae PL171]|uniref:Uncharacterized protein n=1 Tax=Catenaria anguillulae PL171 TaxID=765915 RepID=A0A1Y2I4Z5_9FUNG|nr:hypothetical protein BCR44DRAFT_67938 [Catenaria anguillulae PL171]